MMSVEYIRQLSDEAAERAAQDDEAPFALASGDELVHAPFVGDYVHRKWDRLTWGDVLAYGVPLPRTAWAEGYPDHRKAGLSVDGTGRGSVDEPALTLQEAADWLDRLLASDELTTFGVAIVETGAFQVYIGLYARKEW